MPGSSSKRLASSLSARFRRLSDQRATWPTSGLGVRSCPWLSGACSRRSWRHWPTASNWSGTRPGEAATDPHADQQGAALPTPQVSRPESWRRLRGSNPRGGCNPLHAFQACAFDRSAKPPSRSLHGRIAAADGGRERRIWSPREHALQVAVRLGHAEVAGQCVRVRVRPLLRPGCPSGRWCSLRRPARTCSAKSWHGRTIEAFAQRWDRKPGRPPKTA